MSILEKEINGVKVSANKWPFSKLLLRQRKLIQLGGSSIDPIITALGVEEGEGDEDIKAIVKAVMDVMMVMDEETLKWFESTILDGVFIDGKDMNDIGLRDTTLAGAPGLFIEICIFVIHGNCSDFLELLRTRLGFDLSTVLKKKQNG